MYRLLLILLLPMTAGAEQLVDPTMPPDHLLLPAIEDEVDGELEAFRLSGILLSPAGSSAIVNGIRVNVGEEVGGGKVVAIEATTVSIQTAKEVVELRLIPMQIKTAVGRGTQ